MAQFLDAHDIPERAAYAVNLAVDELVVNVMRYAYVDDETHTIDLKLATRGGPGHPATSWTTADRSIRAQALRSTCNAEEREAGGLGLLLVLDMVDVLKYQRVRREELGRSRVHCSRDNRAVVADCNPRNAKFRGQ